MRTIFSCCLLTFVCLFIGCDIAVPESGSGERGALEPQIEKPVDHLAEATTLTKEGITAKIASWEETEQLVKSHAGKVVVLDLWSTWCEPCLRELPYLVALQKKYPDQVVAISFNMNYDGSKSAPPESNGDDILEALAKMKADIHNIISSTPDEDLYEKIDLASIPAVLVYSADGKLAKRFSDESGEYGQTGFSYEKHITPFVEKLLKK